VRAWLNLDNKPGREEIPFSYSCFFVLINIPIKLPH
jgi:hypothetical protein